MEPEALKKLLEENQAAEKQLTKRNEQYIFDLKKSLKAANLSGESQAVALHDILLNLVEGQKSGKTARQLYGTVREQTEVILTKPNKIDVTSDKKLLWMDTSLLMFGFISIAFSLFPLFSKQKTQPTNGIITLIVISMATGLMMMLMEKYVYQYDRPGADKSKKPGFLKSMGIMAIAVVIWIAVYVLALMIPPTINVVLDPLITIVIGALALAGRYFLKRKYNIQSSLFRTR